MPWVICKETAVREEHSLRMISKTHAPDDFQGCVQMTENVDMEMGRGKDALSDSRMCCK